MKRLAMHFLGVLAWLAVATASAADLVEGKDYVLGKFSAEQRRVLAPTISRACDALVAWIEKGIEPAMSQYNAKDEGGRMKDEG